MTSRRTLVIRFLYTCALIMLVVLTIGSYAVFQSWKDAFATVEQPIVDTTEPFPISVDPLAKQIEPVTIVEEYHAEYLTSHTPKNPVLAKVIARLAPHGWYQQLASPVSRIFVIWPGERKEEIAKHVAGVLRWDNEQKETFVETLTSLEPSFAEGTFYPDQYVTHRSARPEEIAQLINERFVSEIDSRYSSELEAIVPLEEALILASLLEREASSFENMREVSGVIWNRRFIDMPLQLDATLQYARGSNPNVASWWPAVRPSDKYLDSPYNTYQNDGLPPAPIANVSAEAVLAALNPVQTDCLFYFHDRGRNYHCSPTYEEHVAKLKAMYGRGK